MTCIENILQNSEVLGKDGFVKVEKACKGKLTGLYFSGVWCPPCREFTSTLRRFYEQFRSQIEIIFISWDYDEEDFSDYYEDMPWLALPYSERKVKESLSRAYNVIGTPRLVILREDGSIVSMNARQQILSNADIFPENWTKTRVSIK